MLDTLEVLTFHEAVWHIGNVSSYLDVEDPEAPRLQKSRPPRVPGLSSEPLAKNDQYDDKSDYPFQYLHLLFEATGIRPEPQNGSGKFPVSTLIYTIGLKLFLSK